MSSTKITLLAFALVAVVAACAKKADEVVYVDEPVLTTEQPTGKYK